MKYLFGPVLSRRLGRSLGIDLIPYKTCSFDCVYCECGKTTNKIITPHEFFPVEEIIEELDSFLKNSPEIDFITFSGSGEPTLYLKIDEIIKFLKENYPQYKVALLTNGSLLYREDIRKKILDVDVCVPSLDSATERGFKLIDRPHKNLSISDIIEGIKKTKEELKNGELWLEIFIVPGINDTKEELEALKRAVDYIKPNRIQINSLDRPPAEDWVKPLSEKEKEEILKYLKGEILDRDIIYKKYLNKNKKLIPFNTLKGLVLESIKRRPQSIEDLAESLEVPQEAIEDVIDFLKDRNLIEKDLNGFIKYKSF